MTDGAPSMVELGFRLVGCLALVVGLLFLIARFANRRFTAAAGAPVQVIARQQITRSSGIAVVTVGDRVLVVGTTDQQVSLLAELEPDELVDPVVPGADLDDLDAFGGLDDLEERDHLEERGGRDREPVAAGRVPSQRRADAAPTDGALAGSVLSPATWKQTLAFFTGADSTDRPRRSVG
ncbi:flagellar biosynthetic protein FliO [Nocardioides sp. YIM 152588]|uniref:FliO/MopB family protein n=1 Tax=Nocardioides sp. YIM 152588 TaxID=3158259 RepID=UPI0032E38E44